jgi:hypothetical protein
MMPGSTTRRYRAAWSIITPPHGGNIHSPYRERGVFGQGTSPQNAYGELVRGPLKLESGEYQATPTCRRGVVTTPTQHWMLSPVDIPDGPLRPTNAAGTRQQHRHAAARAPTTKTASSGPLRHRPRSLLTADSRQLLRAYTGERGINQSLGLLVPP